MIKAFLRDRGGAAAVEFGLVLPVLAALLIGVFDGGTLLLKYNTMHSAVSSGAQYVMAGGQDLTTAQSIAVSAWKTKPSNAQISVAKTCKCGAAAAVCTTICPDQSVPQAFVSIAATANVNGAVISQPIAATETVRVR